MILNRRVSQRGIDLIKSFEGFNPNAVSIGGDQWMVGYGHTDSAAEDTVLTEREAQAVLREYDLPPIETAISETVLAPLNQNEFDALASLGWNIGEDAFRVSQVVAELNAGARLRAAAAFGAWRKARINGRLMVVDALVRRRAIEVALFLSDPAGRPIAPAAVIRPQLDLAAAFATPEPDASIVAAEVQGDALALFESPPAATSEKPDDADGDVETSPAEAVRRVSERLTRILGEPTPAPGLGADDVASAVSALVEGESSGAASEIDQTPRPDLATGPINGDDANDTEATIDVDPRWHKTEQDRPATDRSSEDDIRKQTPTPKPEASSFKADMRRSEPSEPARPRPNVSSGTTTKRPARQRNISLAILFFIMAALGMALATWGWSQGLLNAWGEMNYLPVLELISGSLIALIGLYFLVRSIFFAGTTKL